MLERFSVPGEAQVLVPEPSLRSTVAAIFEKHGVPPEDAATGADVLVMADLRGVESHGVSNMLRVYVQRYREGRLNPQPAWRVDRETPGISVIDGDRGLGVIQGPRAMHMAIEKARQVGIGIVTVRNSDHLGAVGHHAMLAAQQDMVGVCMTSAGLRVVPTFGAERRLGTNPLSIAAPARSKPPVLFDVATSAIAGNKIRLSHRIGSLMEAGWISSMDGTPIMEPSLAPPEGHYYQLPLGGTREQGSHKGYGLALMVEILAGFLSGGTPIMLDGSSGAKHYFAAYDINAFTDLDHFKDTMDETLQTLLDTKPAPRQERVIYPGWSEYHEEQKRRANGIPLHTEVVNWFNQITEELSIPSLETRPSNGG